MDHFRGKVFRQCHPDHTDLTATIGASRSRPFRFNPPDEFGVLYVALSPQTARAELARQAGRLGVPLSKLAPRLMLHLRLDLERILDLTNLATRQARGLASDDLVTDDYSRCQQVARDARREGFEAIRYPSATGSGENLAIFYDQIGPTSRVEITGREILPLVD